MHKIILSFLAIGLVTPTTANAQTAFPNNKSVTVYSLDGPPEPIQYSPPTPRPAAPIFNPEAAQATAETAANTAADTIEIAEPPSGIDWSGRANIGGTIQTGNTEEESINADTTLSARWGANKHRATLKAEYNRETQNDNKTEDNRIIQGMYDYFFAEKWFWNNIVSYEQDDVEDLDSRINIGTGLGHQPFDSDALSLKYVAGPTYLREELNNGDTEDSLTARWALDYSQRVWDEALQLFHEHEFLLPTDDTDAYLFYSKTGVRVPIKDGLVATAEIDFEWDNAPAAGVKEEDTMYALKLGYEW